LEDDARPSVYSYPKVMIAHDDRIPYRNKNAKSREELSELFQGILVIHIFFVFLTILISLFHEKASILGYILKFGNN